eukprot:12890964-Prorocentrum_lima.AAC.1
MLVVSKTTECKHVPSQEGVFGAESPGCVFACVGGITVVAMLCGVDASAMEVGTVKDDASLSVG